MADAIDSFVRESNKQIGRTKTRILKSMKPCDKIDKHWHAIAGAGIVEFAL